MLDFTHLEIFSMLIEYSLNLFNNNFICVLLGFGFHILQSLLWIMWNKGAALLNSYVFFIFLNICY